MLLSARFYIFLIIYFFAEGLVFFLDVLFCLYKVLFPFRFIVPLWEGFIEWYQFNFLSTLIDNLLKDLFGLLLSHHIGLNIVHKLLSFLLVDVRLMLAVDDLAILFHSQRF